MLRVVRVPAIRPVSIVRLAEAGIVRAHVRRAVIACRRAAMILRKGIGAIGIGGPGRDYTRAMKCSRLGGGGDRRVTVIFRSQQAAIAARHLLMLRLQGSRRGVTLAFGEALSSGRLRRGAPGAAVVADVVDRGVIDDRIVHVGVVNHRGVHIGHRGVVRKHSVAPFTAVEADAPVAIAIVNAAIKADVRAPVARMPYIDAPAPTPIARSPQQTECGRHYPGARDPKISIRTISPITGSPEISWARANGLRIDRQHWRADVHGDANGNLRGSCAGNGHKKQGQTENTCEFPYKHLRILAKMGATWGAGAELSSSCSKV